VKKARPRYAPPEGVVEVETADKALNSLLDEMAEQIKSGNVPDPSNMTVSSIEVSNAATFGDPNAKSAVGVKLAGVGRGPTGKLRNFKQMGDEKLVAVQRQLSEQLGTPIEDLEAYDRATDEAHDRGLIGP